MGRRSGAGLPEMREPAPGNRRGLLWRRRGLRELAHLLLVLQIKSRSADAEQGEFAVEVVSRTRPHVYGVAVLDRQFRAIDLEVALASHDIEDASARGALGFVKLYDGENLPEKPVIISMAPAQ